MALKKAGGFEFYVYKSELINLRTFTTDTSGQLDVLWHDGDSLGVDGTQVGVLEQTHQISLARFLKSGHCRALKAQIGLEVLCDLADETLKRQLSDQQLGAFLVSTNLAKSHCAWTVSVWFFDTTGSRGAFAGSFGGQLLSWRFTSS